MKILYILKHNPWGIGGGCYASKIYLKLFAELFDKHKIDVLVCSEYLKDKKGTEDFANCNFIPVPPRSKVWKYLIPLTHVLHRHQAYGERLIKSNDYNYCIFDHNSIGGSLVDLCKKRNIKTIVLNHNCEQQYFKENHSAIRNTFILPSVISNEKKSYLRCDYNIFLTKEDNSLFHQLYGDTKSNIIIGGYFLKSDELNYNNPRKYKGNRIRFVISGSMDNLQNLDGINYFLDHLYKYIPDNAEIILTGKNPSNEIIEKTKIYNNINVIPNPADIYDIVNNCDVYLCTTKLGGGMKLRIMDGIKCNLPIISHAVSARGYSELEEHGVLFSFSNEVEFAKIINKIINFSDSDKKVINSNLLICKKNLTFESKLNLFKEILLKNKL